jgi:hypothetical protein
MKATGTNSWTGWPKKVSIYNGSITDHQQSEPISISILVQNGGQLIERRVIIIPNDEKLIAQLTSRRKLYDSKGRERLESEADLQARGVESPDRADALIGAVMMRLSADPYAFDPAGRQAMHEMMDQTIRRMERNRSRFAVEHVNWDRL